MRRISCSWTEIAVIGHYLNFTSQVFLTHFIHSPMQINHGSIEIVVYRKPSAGKYGNFSRDLSEELFSLKITIENNIYNI